MGYSAHVGSFNLTTGAGGTTQEISDCGFEPKIVMFWWGGGHTTGDEVVADSIAFGFGAAIDSTHRFQITNASADAAATSATYRSMTADYCIEIRGTAGAVLGCIDFSSMDADGFTLVVDVQCTSDWRIYYLALGGTDLTNVYIGSQAMAVSAGNYNVTGVGFQPDAVITASYWYTSVSNGVGIYFTLGMATGASNQGVVYGESLNAQATSDTKGYGYNGEILASRQAGFRDAFVSFGADGFTLNHLEGATAHLFNYICLKGGQYSVGDLTTRTDGNDIEENLGFQPAAILFASANRALSTQDTPTDNMRLSIGAATATDHRACIAVSDEDNLADSETAYANYDSAVYAHVVDDATVGLMDIKSIEADGFTCVMDDTDPSGCWVTYLAIGAAATGTTQPPRSMHLHRMRLS